MYDDSETDHWNQSHTRQNVCFRWDQTCDVFGSMGDIEATFPQTMTDEIDTVALFESLPEAEACKLRLESEG